MVCYSILLIWDDTSADAATQSIKNNLESFINVQIPLTSSQDTVIFQQASMPSYNGTNPPITDFHGAMHFNTYNVHNNNIPNAGQTAIQNWVNSGGVYIGSAWMSFGNSHTDYATNMSNLLLYPQFSTITKTSYGTTKFGTLAGGDGFYIYTGELGGGNYVGNYVPVGGVGINNNDDTDLNTILSASDLKYLDRMGTSFRHATRATDMSHNQGANGTNLIFMSNSSDDTAATTHAVPYLVKKDYGKGIVFSANDSFDLTSLSSSRFNSPLRSSFVTDYLRNILENINFYLFGNLSNLCANICFPSGTLIKTDQGEVEIQNINPEFHTIDNKKINHVTKTRLSDDKLVSFKKNSLGKNVPNKKTVMSGFHKVRYNGIVYEAYKLANVLKDVKYVTYDGEYLYNILMDDWQFIKVQNMFVETLHPDNIIAKLYNSNLSEEKKMDFILEINKCVEKEDYEAFHSIKSRILNH